MTSHPPAIPEIYCGRFAPTPSGPLHFGSVIAALGSYLQARHLQGKWYLRIEDIDHPRIDPEATRTILTCLEKLGLYWDGKVQYQLQRQARYDEIIQHLEKEDLVFPCACSRKQLPPGPYPGRCRNGLPPGKAGRSIRLKTDDGSVSFTDTIQGDYQQCLKQEVGDFIIHRGDDITSYHLCVVVDDYDMNITEVVRGVDLIDSTPRQIYLQDLLGFTRPAYMHLPVAINSDGNKLSKQTFATPVDPDKAEFILIQALEFLGQNPGNELDGSNVDDILTWGCRHWSTDRIPKVKSIPVINH